MLLANNQKEIVIKIKITRKEENIKERMTALQEIVQKENIHKQENEVKRYLNITLE